MQFSPAVKEVLNAEQAKKQREEEEKEAKNANEKYQDKNNLIGRGRHGKTRRFKGGNGYGFTATPGDVINAGNLAWTPNMTSVPSGQPVVGSVTGGRRRSRKNQKSQKTRRARARSARLIKELASYKMKGGGSVANVGYGFAGTGARGISDAIGYPSNLPPSGQFAIPTGTR